MKHISCNGGNLLKVLYVVKLNQVNVPGMLDNLQEILDYKARYLESWYCGINLCSIGGLGPDRHVNWFRADNIRFSTPRVLT